MPTPGQEPCSAHALRFSHKGAGLGLPLTGNILFWEWGEEEEREGRSRSTFLAFLATAPSSCFELPLPGTGSGPGCLGMTGQPPTWGALGLGALGDPSGPSPTHPMPSQKQTNPHSVKRGLGGLGTVVSTGEGFSFWFYLLGSPPPACSLPPREALDSSQRTEVDGWRGERERAPGFQPLVAGTVIFLL